MSTAAAPDRQFSTASRGDIREDILTSFRVGLRQLVNPSTGATFTESEIAIATADLGRFWSEADAIDLALMPAQARALFLADQVNIGTAGSAFIAGYHAVEWDVPKLGAAGGSGDVLAPAAAGTTFVGSTTVPDPAATVGTDPSGKSYQVLFTESVAPGASSVTLALVGIDTGPATNLSAGTKITWSNGPLGATGDASVIADFEGGFAEESDRDWAQRILDGIRHKQAAGNNSQMRSWARKASVAVADAYVYACAFDAGSVLLAITQKRGAVLGPTGRVPSVGTMAAVVAFVTPPASPVVPVPPHVVAVPFVSVPSDLVLSLSMPKGSSSGWADQTPFPAQAAGVGSSITAVTTQQSFRIDAKVAALPAGVTAPKMMAWNAGTSRFESLLVQSVVSAGGTLFDVVLSAPPSMTLTVGTMLSPDSARRELLAENVEAYFDTLGPGEVVDLSSDARAHRAFRFPEPSETAPQRCGSAVISFLQDAFGATLADGEVESVSVATPAIPADPIAGPNMIVAGKLGAYAL